MFVSLCLCVCGVMIIYVLSMLRSCMIVKLQKKRKEFMIVYPNLYEKSRACFDPTQVIYQTLDRDGFSQTIVPMEDHQQQLLSYSHQDSVAHDQPNCETLQNLNYNHCQQIQELQHHNNNNGCSFSVTKKKVDNHISLFAAEKQRRQLLNEKYATLKSLVPISTKHDRASVVGDAINYIKVLHRTLNELQILVMKKERHGREMLGMQKIEYKSVLEVERKIAMKHHGDADQAYNGSSWLQRKSKNTEVDVRIIDDEVTINIVHQKRINSMLFVSKVLDELHLDLQHVAGGLVGDFYNCMFNTKIYEGSSVYASAVANKIIDVVDKEYAASQPTPKC